MSRYLTVINKPFEVGLLKKCSQNCPIHGEFLFRFIFTSEIQLNRYPCLKGKKLPEKQNMPPPPPQNPTTHKPLATLNK